jgi:hypothetical protein
MSEPMVLARITATPAAREAIRLLRAARGGPVMFVQSGGCCAGSTPMCFPAGEFLIGDIDVLLGEIGEPKTSLPAGDNLHFFTRSPTCVSPNAPEENALSSPAPEPEWSTP